MGEAAPEEFRPSVIYFTLGPLIHDDKKPTAKKLPFSAQAEKEDGRTARVQAALNRATKHLVSWE
jgi:hypothetical protein